MGLIDGDSLIEKAMIKSERQYLEVMVASLPTIDIVRCEECKHWFNEHQCLMWSRYGTLDVKCDDFCSYGERKGE